MTPYKSPIGNAVRVVLFVFSIVLPVCHVFAQSWESPTILKASVQKVNDYFGSCVAISDNYAAVAGAITTMDQKAPVNIFKRTQNGYELTQVLNAPGEDPFVAGSIALNDAYLVIGQPTPFSGFGKAHIYKKDSNGDWNHIQVIQSSDNHGLDRFGTTVAISGNTIVVSSPGKSIEYYEGAIYIFELDVQTGIWSEKQKIMTSDSQRDDYFGYSLAIEGGLLLAASPNDDEIEEPYSNFGAVYFFQRSESGIWEEKQKLVAPERKTNAFFGSALDIDRDDVIIGAKGEDYYGAAYIFSLQDNAWVLDHHIVQSSQYEFGHDVAISNGLAVVSSASQDAQYIHSYKRSQSGQWEALSKVYSPRFHVSYESESFGKAIDFHGGSLIVGAPHAIASTGTNYDPPRAGEALVYKIAVEPLPFEKVDWMTAQGKGKFPKLVDFDNDGDLDLSVGYYDDDNGINETRLYRFTDNLYDLMDQKFPALEYYSDMVWLDVNGDGWLDFIIRNEENYEAKIKLYLNHEGKDFQFKDVSGQLMADKWRGKFYLGDYDNDADEDLLVQLEVEPGEKPMVRVLANDGKFVFTETQFYFEGSITSSQPWFDFDNDGDLDFVINQEITCDQHALVAYQNQGEGFQKITTDINTLSAFWAFQQQNGDMVWADYDNDGDGDMVWSGITGCSSGDGSSNVTVNNGGSFSQGNASFRTILGEVHLNMIDINNDGLLDLVPYGSVYTGRPETAFFLGSGSSFNKLNLYEMPTPYQEGGAVVGDIEGDGDIDVLIAGDSRIFAPEIMVYRNNAAEGWASANQRPLVPSDIKVTSNEHKVELTWNQSSDDTTPQKALTYNVTLMRNDSVIITSHSNSDGFRQYYQRGNMGHRREHELKNLKDGHYKIAVQAIDNAYEGSAFTQFVEFQIPGIVLAAEHNEDTAIRVFPNPAQDKLIIESHSGMIEKTEIHNTLGRSLQMESDIHSNMLDLSISHLQPGIYFLTIKTIGGRKSVQRFVKL